MNDIVMAVEEISMDSAIAISGSKSTLYRWRNAMNSYLEDNRYGWRVKASPKNMVLYAAVME